MADFTKLEKHFEELVPSEGKADTVAGEVVRALNRLNYRCYNDGDRIGVDYGNETCNMAARYLMEKLPDELGTEVSKLWGWNGMNDDEYMEALAVITDKTLDWLDTTDLREQPNTDDIFNYVDDDDARWVEEEEDDEYYEDEYYDDEDDYEDEDDCDLTDEDLEDIPYDENGMEM